ncbi:MAG: endonuclease/exonuclease/phosphatase family protein [Bacteroidales bacterium]|nr:endonuclease/exonuclease/phosphatase family protein [Bacteroidales bacterium]
MKVIRIILLILNIIAALGLVVTTLAGLVSPSTSILPSVLAYAFLPMLALNVVFVLVWLMMGKWQFLISTAAIAARFSFVGLFFQVGGTSTVPPLDEHPDMVTLMSFNVHLFGGNGYESTPKKENAQAFLQLLREEQPMVLCLQEYGSVKGMSVTDSLELMGYNHYFGSRGSNTAPANTVVFSKLPITYVKKIDQQKILVEILHGERPFRLLCVHMGSYSFDLNDRAEVEQMAHLRIDSTSRRTLGKAKETVLRHETEWNEQLRPLVADCKMPLLLAGDMNDIPSSWLYKQISLLLDDTYRDKGLGFCTTYNGSFPRFRIDMVFHSPQFSTLSYRRIGNDLSDHYPVLVSLEMNDK